MEKKKKSTFFTLTIWLRESFGLALCLRWCGAGRCPGTSGAVGTHVGMLPPNVPGAPCSHKWTGLGLAPASGAWFCWNFSCASQEEGLGVVLGVRSLLSPSLFVPLLGACHGHEGRSVGCPPGGQHKIKPKC